MKKMTFYGRGDFLREDFCLCAWPKTPLGCCGSVNLPRGSAHPGVAEPCCAEPSAPAVGLGAGVFFIKALNHIQDVSVCSSHEITQTTHPQFGFRRASAARPESSAEQEQSSPLLLRLGTRQCGEGTPFMCRTCPGKPPGSGDGIRRGLGAGADSSLGLALGRGGGSVSRGRSGTISRDQPCVFGGLGCRQALCK